MRLIKAALLVTVLAVSATAAHAGTMTFGLGGGIASPMGDFADFAKLGFNGNVFGDYWVNEMYAIGVDVDGSFFGGDKDLEDALQAIPPGYPDAKATATLIGGGIHGMLAIPMKDSPVSPWVTAGVGMYNVKAKIEDSDPLVNIDESDTKVGFHGGGGIDFKAGETMKVGVNVNFNSISTEGDATNYITAGVRLTFMTTGTTQ